MVLATHFYRWVTVKHLKEEVTQTKEEVRRTKEEVKQLKVEVTQTKEEGRQFREEVKGTLATHLSLFVGHMATVTAGNGFNDEVMGRLAGLEGRTSYVERRVIQLPHTVNAAAEVQLVQGGCSSGQGGQDPLEELRSHQVNRP